jgi:hypothetical protein
MVALVVAGFSKPAMAGDLTVTLPAGAEVGSATATATDLQLDIAGTVSGSKIVFANLLPDTAYDVAVKLADGTTLQGVNMNWYDLQILPARKPAPLGDEDRDLIRKIVTDIQSFYNDSKILLLRGDSTQAVGLVQLVKDDGFHSDKGGEAIWRIELWYFKNDYGGWDKISQVNKILRRVRFPSHAEFEATRSKIKWIPDLGGIVMPKGQDRLAINLPSLEAAHDPPPGSGPNGSRPPAPGLTTEPPSNAPAATPSSPEPPPDSP